MYVLPEKLRPALAAPLAPPLATAEAVAAAKAAPVVVSVGDVVTEMLLDHGVRPRVVVVDFKTQRGPAGFETLRRKIQEQGYRRERVDNPPATITVALWDALAAAVRRTAPTALEVVGEEDLAVLPAVTLAPDGTAVVYGQPNRGAVVVHVDKVARDRVRTFLADMKPPES